MVSPRMLRRVEGNFLEQFFHHGIQAPRADVLGLLVHLQCDFRQALDRRRLKLELHAFGRQQRLVLAREAGVGVGEDVLEIVDRQARELDADREAPLQLRDQVGRLGQVERAARDEQDVVGLDHAVLGRDGRAFDQRQQVALHALARDVGAVRFASGW